MAQIMARQASENNAGLIKEGSALRDEYAGLVETDPEKASELWNKASELMLQATNWKAVWMYPAVMTGVILILFVALFHDKIKPTENDSQDG